MGSPLPPSYNTYEKIYKQINHTSYKNLYDFYIRTQPIKIYGRRILDSPVLRMNFVLKLDTPVHASIDIALASFLTLAICGILYLLQFFLPYKI